MAGRRGVCAVPPENLDTSARTFARTLVRELSKIYKGVFNMKEKVIRVELEIKRRARGEEHTSKYEASIWMNDQTTVSNIADFVDDMHKLWGKAMAAAKNSANVPDINMEICEAVYEHEPGSEFKTGLFNRWYLRDMEDISTMKGEESIYLVPDDRYTDPVRDMSISKNILRDMAFTMG